LQLVDRASLAVRARFATYLVSKKFGLRIVRIRDDADAS
jgi:hypothetical protein